MARIPKYRIELGKITLPPKEYLKKTMQNDMCDTKTKVPNSKSASSESMFKKLLYTPTSLFVSLQHYSHSR